MAGGPGERMSLIGCCAEGECETLVVAIPGPPGSSGGAPGNRIQITGTAAVPLSGHRAVYRRADGLIEYASSDNPAHIGVPIWVTTGAASASTTVTMVALGEIVEGSWTWTPGPIFLGINGALTQTPPAEPVHDFLAVLGYAPTSTRMYVNRQTSVDLI